MDDERRDLPSMIANEPALSSFIERMGPHIEKMVALLDHELAEAEVWFESLEESFAVMREVPDRTFHVIRWIQSRHEDEELKKTLANLLCSMMLDPAFPVFVRAMLLNVRHTSAARADHPLARFVLELRRAEQLRCPERATAIVAVWRRIAATTTASDITSMAEFSFLAGPQGDDLPIARAKAVLEAFSGLVEVRYRKWLALLVGTLSPLYDDDHYSLPFQSRLYVGQLGRRAETLLKELGYASPHPAVDSRHWRWRNAVAHRNWEFDAIAGTVRLWNEQEDKVSWEEEVTFEEVEERYELLMEAVGPIGGLEGALGGSLAMDMDDGLLQWMEAELLGPLEHARPKMEQVLLTGDLMPLLAIE